MSSRCEAHRKIKLAKALETDWLDTVDSMIKTQARDHLLAAAKHHDAKALAIQGRRILDVVAPEAKARRSHPASLLVGEGIADFRKALSVDSDPGVRT